MKTLIILSSLLVSLNLFAKDKGNDFNKLMMEDVKEDLIKHEDTYKKSPSRGPASVEKVSSGERLEDQMNQDKKIEKMNFRQNQPSRW